MKRSHDFASPILPSQKRIRAAIHTDADGTEDGQRRFCPSGDCEGIALEGTQAILEQLDTLVEKREKERNKEVREAKGGEDHIPGAAPGS